MPNSPQQPQETSPDIGLWTLATITLVAIGVLVALLIVIEAIGAWVSFNKDVYYEAAFLASLFAAACSGYGRLTPEAQQRLWPAWPGSTRVRLRGMAHVLGCLAITLLLDFAVFGWFLTHSPESLPTSTATGFQYPLLAILAYPLVEELLFRGVLLNGLAGRYGFRAANLISALLFGLAHGHPIKIATCTCFGLMAGWLFWRRGSLLPCLGLHISTNAIAVAIGKWL